MILFKQIKELQAYLGEQRKQNAQIGFVPTLGALHKGHLSLIHSCNKRNNITVCSIFVNPTQFNNISDYEKYPVTLEDDIYLLEKNNCNILFLPSIDEVYPDGTSSAHKYDLGYLETVLEGKYRPGHFQGVCQVVHRLLTIVQPHQLFLGQKDYQQCLVLKQLLKTISIPVQIIIEPTLREPGGLAMSSRNSRLSNTQKKQAESIFETLTLIKNEIKRGNLQELKQKATHLLLDKEFWVDYVEIADADNLAVVENWDGRSKLVALIAAFIGDVRLIDNLLL